MIAAGILDPAKVTRSALQNAQLAEVVKSISEGPLIPLAGVQMARHKYIESSSMTPPEKEAAILTVTVARSHTPTVRVPTTSVWISRLPHDLAGLRVEGSPSEIFARQLSGMPGNTGVGAFTAPSEALKVNTLNSYSARMADSKYRYLSSNILCTNSSVVKFFWLAVTRPVQPRLERGP
jgi:hypothetical protein